MAYLSVHDLPLVPVFITQESQPRATAFIMRMPVSAASGQDLYAHAVLVTALHSVLDDRGRVRPALTLNFPWMGGQGGASYPLKNLRWDYFTLDQLDDDEDFLDLAAAPLHGIPYTGVQIGRSAVAVHIDGVHHVDAFDVGAEVCVAGLVSHYSGSLDDIEPALRFGRISMVPRGRLPSHRGAMDALLVESLATRGMSGAPVFVRSGDSWMLAGVHTGHFEERALFSERPPEGEKGDPAGLANAPKVHSGLSVVVPVSRVIDVLELDALRSVREEAEQDLRRHAWRFVDRRHRERHAVVLAERHYGDMMEYLDDEDYFAYQILFLRPAGPAELSARIDSWNETQVAPIGSLLRVRALLGQVLPNVRWMTESTPVDRGWFEEVDGEGFNDWEIELYFHHDDVGRQTEFIEAVLLKGRVVDLEYPHVASVLRALEVADAIDIATGRRWCAPDPGAHSPPWALKD